MAFCHDSNESISLLKIFCCGRKLPISMNLFFLPQLFASLDIYYWKTYKNSNMHWLPFKTWKENAFFKKSDWLNKCVWQTDMFFKQQNFLQVITFRQVLKNKVRVKSPDSGLLPFFLFNFYRQIWWVTILAFITQNFNHPMIEVYIFVWIMQKPYLFWYQFQNRIEM